MSVEPLKQYVEGVIAYHKGDREKALQLIASSLGADTPTPQMRDSLDELVTPNEATLALIVHRSQEE